jgi:hypothetical protein
MLSFLLFFQLLFHPVHVSVASMEYDTEKKGFFISFKVFTADLESVIQNKYGVSLNLGKSDERADYQDYVLKYLNTHFALEVNHKVQTLVFINKKTNEDAIWLYGEYRNIPTIQQLKIYNSLFIEDYLDQSNLLIFKYLDKEEGYTFNLTENEKEIIK